MDRELLKQWKRGYEAMNESTLEEKRRRTPAERLEILEALLVEIRALGVELRGDWEDHMHWSRIHEQVLARGTPTGSRSHD